jgi:hypothetical protein
MLSGPAAGKKQPELANEKGAIINSLEISFRNESIPTRKRARSFHGRLEN